MARQSAKPISTTGSAASPPTAHSDAQKVSPVASASRDQVQRAALLASVTGRSFEDVKFFAFSRRTRNGSVDIPLPLLANSALIRKASSHFDFVFGAGFSETGITDMDAPYPPTRPSSTDTYDYSSDSDLEDEEDVEGEASSTRDVGAGDHTGVKNDEGISTIAKEDEPEDAGGLGLVQGRGQKQIHGRPGRVVFLGDVAYRTWKAFIFYAYYDDLNFSPLKSQQKPRSKEQDPYKAPLCSPKSMYRIAHKYDIASLKEKASNDIKSKLSPSNILEEIFSTFTSLYPDIQAIELNYLFAIIKDAGVQARLPTWLETMEERRLPKGAAGIVASLIANLSIPPPAPAPAGAGAGMKKCPRGCSTSSYYCQSCGSTF